jgi:cell division protein FtsN
MAKEYGKRNSARNKGSVSKPLLLVLISFLFGYLSASVFDYTSLSSWVNRQLAQHVGPTAAKLTPQQAKLPKPKFEFYTLLASEHNSSDQITTATPTIVAPTQALTPTTPSTVSPANVAANKNGQVATVVTGKPVPILPQAVASKGTDLVQVAAFKSRQEAERMKASLVLKGFSVSITSINQRNMNWYRVNLGPYASRDQAAKAQGAVARSERIVGMIRKMDA